MPGPARGTVRPKAGLEGISAASDSTVSAAGEAVTGSNRLIRSAATLAIITTARAAAATPIHSGGAGRSGAASVAVPGYGASAAGAPATGRYSSTSSRPVSPITTCASAPGRRPAANIRSTVGQYQPASGWVSSPTRYPSIRTSMPHQPAWSPDQSSAGTSSATTWLGGPSSGGVYQTRESWW